MTRPVVTLTLNPAIDAACVADEVVPMRKVRTRDERYDPGGGGLNVARVFRELGGEAVAFYLACGISTSPLRELTKPRLACCRNNASRRALRDSGSPTEPCNQRGNPSRGFVTGSGQARRARWVRGSYAAAVATSRRTLRLFRADAAAQWKAATAPA